MSFVVPGRSPSAGETPETLFRSLRRDKDGPQHLWAHQADLLRAYSEQVNAPDLALELPTGAGKTLVGMLIADWRRRRRERVLYLCPTKQLARQAAADAARAGISVVDLTGSHRQWNRADKLAYDRSEAVAVAAYTAVFNSNSHLDDAHVLIFDDAHSAAGPVLDAWTVEFEHGSAGYSAVLDLCADGLEEPIIARLRAGSEDPHEMRNAYLIDPRVVAAHADQLVVQLAAAAEDTDEWWPSCCMFIAHDRVQIRPLIPPTGSHAAFNEPRQRLYLSATLGDGGELERAFGRPSIGRLPIPAGWDERGTGRRFFLFPELSADLSGADERAALDTFVKDAITFAGRCLVLTPSERRLIHAVNEYVPNSATLVRAGDIATSLTPFTDAGNDAVLALANRYDGIDLPDDDCRLIVLDGLPIGADPHERFLAFTLGAKRVVQERMRTRLVQGAGRATRNANDYSAVIVLGHELVSFCATADAQTGTHPEVRAELEFGIVNSAGRPSELMRENLEHFFGQDSVWTDLAEPGIANLRDAARDSGTARVDSVALAGSARAEIRAVEEAWRGNWDRSVGQAERAITELSGGSELRPYQALWNYIAGCWASFAAEQDPTYAALSDTLLDSAASAAVRTGWVPRRRRAGSLSGTASAEQAHEPVDDAAAAAAVRYLKRLGSRRAVADARRALETNLGSTQAATYEQGLVDLGLTLGAHSEKPSGQARADALWIFGDDLWVAWEAKSEQLADHPIDAHAVRQANTHLRAAAADLDASIPPGSFIVLATPRTALDASVTPLAEDSLVIVDPDVVLELLADVLEIWDLCSGRIVADRLPTSGMEAAVYREMVQRRLLPSVLKGRMSGRLI
jgi:hypothetical protein